MGDDPNISQKLTQAQKDARDIKMKSALAMELPFTIVGAIVVAGLLGYLADRLLHTWPWLTAAGGALGFAASVFEITRRFRPR